MLEYLQAIYEGATDTSPSDAIGALLLGFLFALACSGVCVWLQKKTANPLPLPMLCGLIFVVCAGSMTFGIGHSRYRLKEGVKRFAATVNADNANAPGGRAGKGRPRAPMGPPPIGWSLLQEADLDKNGQLTPEEAADFIRKADKAGKGWATVSDIDQARRGTSGDPSAPAHAPEAVAVKVN